MVPEGRKEQGMFLKLSVLDNMTMVHLRELANRLTLIYPRKRERAAAEYVDHLSIKTPSLAQISQNERRQSAENHHRPVAYAQAAYPFPG